MGERHVHALPIPAITTYRVNLSVRPFPPAEEFMRLQPLDTYCVFQATVIENRTD
jgi:hypothetical protein